MTCIVDEREEIEAARRALLDHDDVLGASIAGPWEGSLNRWTIELALREGCGGLDGAASSILAEFGLTVRLCQPQGTAWWALVTV